MNKISKEALEAANRIVHECAELGMCVPFKPIEVEIQKAIDAATAELRQDKKRMDWLEESNHADLLHCDCRAGHYIEGLDMATQPNVRAAIDKAMKKKPCSSTVAINTTSCPVRKDQILNHFHLYF